RNDGKQVARQEGSQRRDRRAFQTADQETDEPDRNDHRARGNHGDRHGIEELAVVEPLKFLYHTTVQKRNNPQAAAEHKGPSFREEQEPGPERVRMGGGDSRKRQAKGRYGDAVRPAES